MMSVERFESRVGQWIGINPFFSKEKFYCHDLSVVYVSTTILSFFKFFSVFSFFFSMYVGYIGWCYVARFESYGF